MALLHEEAPHTHMDAPKTADLAVQPRCAPVSLREALIAFQFRDQPEWQALSLGGHIEGRDVALFAQAPLQSKITAKLHQSQAAVLGPIFAQFFGFDRSEEHTSELQ